MCLSPLGPGMILRFARGSGHNDRAGALVSRQSACEGAIETQEALVSYKEVV